MVNQGRRLAVRRPLLNRAALQLFSAHRAALVNYASGIVGDPDQAEDLVQETAALYRDKLERALAAIAELPERTRIALEMHRFCGCKLKEITAFLGISVPLAHMLVADGVQHCKDRLGRMVLGKLAYRW